MRQRMIICSCFLLGCDILLTGCSQSPEPKYYHLSALADKEILGQSTLRLAISPIRLATHLQRKQIVTNKPPTILQFDDSKQWAGQLKENMSLVIAENLYHLTGSEAIFTYPWKAGQPLDYELTLNIRQFELVNEQVVFIAIWQLTDHTTGKIITHRASYREKIEGLSMQTIIQAKNKILLNFSQGLLDYLQ